MSGTEVTLSRDLPKWLGKKLILKLTGGIGLNGIKSQVVTNVPSYIDTTTDYYSLNGAVPPGTSYTGGASELVTFTNPDGTSTSVSRNNFTLISAQPTNRVVTTATNTTAVTNVYKLKGAYFTTRIGPTFIYPFTENLRASVSLGLMAIYAATDFSVDESYLPEVGDPIETSNTKNERKILPGFYVDANVEYWVSDKTGFYAGAAYQGGGSYNQVLLTEESKYTTKVDLKSLSGLRAGMNIRF